jgi:hypothetical protein
MACACIAEHLVLSGSLFILSIVKPIKEKQNRWEWNQK